MIVTLDTAGATVEKVATTPAEAERLDREAAVLAVARHPGIVQLRAARPAGIEISAVTGWCLSDLGRLRPAEVAGIGCAVATILADLHDIGVVHGSVEASHVLIGLDRRPVLCGLGHGRLPHSDAGPNPKDDVTALIEMLGLLLPPSPGDRRRGVSESATADDVRSALGGDQLLSRGGGQPGRRRWPAWNRGGGQPGRRRGGGQPGRRLWPAWNRVPSARQLAGRLAAVPGSRLPDPAQCAVTSSAGVPVQPPAPKSPRNRWPVGVAVAVAVVAAAGGVAGLSSPHRRPSAAAPCPRVDRGCGPVDHRSGLVVTDNGRFSLHEASGNPLVLGRWTCGPALPAVLRTDRGEVWVWDRWPADGTAATARLAGRVEGAETLRASPGPSRCDDLRVTSRDGRVTTLAAKVF